MRPAPWAPMAANIPGLTNRNYPPSPRLPIHANGGGGATSRVPTSCLPISVYGTTAICPKAR